MTPEKQLITEVQILLAKIHNAETEMDKLCIRERELNPRLIKLGWMLVDKTMRLKKNM